MASQPPPPPPPARADPYDVPDDAEDDNKRRTTLNRYHNLLRARQNQPPRPLPPPPAPPAPPSFPLLDNLPANATQVARDIVAMPIPAGQQTLNLRPGRTLSSLEHGKWNLEAALVNVLVQRLRMVHALVVQELASQRALFKSVGLCLGSLMEPVVIVDTTMTARVVCTMARIRIHRRLLAIPPSSLDLDLLPRLHLAAEWLRGRSGL